MARKLTPNTINAPIHTGEITHHHDHVIRPNDLSVTKIISNTPVILKPLPFFELFDMLIIFLIS